MGLTNNFQGILLEEMTMDIMVVHPRTAKLSCFASISQFFIVGFAVYIIYVYIYHYIYILKKQFFFETKNYIETGLVPEVHERTNLSGRHHLVPKTSKKNQWDLSVT